MNKVVLVTGSSRGIGASTILEFASKGFDVVINYIDNDKDVFHESGIDNIRDATNLKKKVEKNFGVRALKIKADVSIKSDVENMFKEIMKKFGRIDVVVNNAGIVFDRDFNDIKLSEIDRVLKVNVVGAFIVSKIASQYLKEGSAIVNVSSTNGTKVISPECLDYNISKIGLQSLTRDLAFQFKPRIRVNAIAIGWADTSLNSQLPKEYVEYENAKIWLNHFASPPEIAKTIYFLASEESSYINGEIVNIDGGYC